METKQVMQESAIEYCEREYPEMMDEFKKKEIYQLELPYKVKKM